MDTIKKILGVMVLVMVLSSVLVVVFREQIKAAAARKFVERWTAVLLEGAPIAPEEKRRISEKLGEFYALAVKKVIPPATVSAVWDKGGVNPGLWYFYLKNFFLRQVKDSGMGELAREKAAGVVRRFLGYIRDGRVSHVDLRALKREVDLRIEESPLRVVRKEDVERTVDTMRVMNEELEKRGPGRPLDPVEKFKEFVQNVERVTVKYRGE